jgi:hypothetical protein
MSTDLLTPCRDREELWQWARTHLGLQLPRTPMCPGHQAPFDYLASTYFEPARDLVVWGPRGGGKTRLAAAATLLDLLHKPGVAVRVLGGSLEQSLRVWEHLVPDLERLAPDLLVRSRSRARRVTLESGSTAAVLTQSQRTVRGQRVQKMRCDEIELFDPRVWQAVAATTKSLTDVNPVVAGVVEALSTYHEPGGLMGQVIERAEASGPGGPKLITWCILDVIARCPPERDCDSCPLWDDCGGRAKHAEGFVSVDDVIAIKRRVSRETWEAELLCRRPTREGRVFPHFSRELHVREFEPRGDLDLGVDFGFRNPFVALWIERTPSGHIRVVDELVRSERTLTHQIEDIKSRPWIVARIACDPAGRSRNEHTGVSSVTLLRKAGWTVHCKPSGIVEGVERLRQIIQPASGLSKFTVHPRCVKLIRALCEYRYDRNADSELPLKDGQHDHPIDALRYYLINLGIPQPAEKKDGY